MTFDEWKKTPEGEKSFDEALKRADGDQGIYIDDLMWTDYKSSEHWEPPKPIRMRSSVPKAEDLKLNIEVLNKYLEDAKTAIEEFQLKDAKKALKSAEGISKDIEEISKLLETKHNIEQR
jgi:hypothetical protein